jgi:cytochrome c biogenesis factor
VILVGELALWVALLMAAWGAIVSFAGGRTSRSDLIASGERAIYAAFVCVVLSTAGLLVALVASDLTFDYVASHTSANLPVPYKVVALWGGSPGSLLFWAFLLTSCAAIAVATNRTRHRALMAYVGGSLSVVTLVLVAALCFAANPYERLALIPPEGTGMDPRLQNPAMALHPPTLYLGYLASAVPFAFALGALLARTLDDEWVHAVRQWSLLSWCFMTLGILSGMWWAYVEVGWRGNWTLDPVTNLSLLPWLATAAFLMSLMMQERRGRVRRWNVILAAATFPLALFSTVAGRGIVARAHSLAQSEGAPWLSALVIVSAVVLTWLIATHLAPLPAAVVVERAVSREARKRRRYGGVLMTGATVVFVIALAGNAFNRETHLSLGPGETAHTVDPYGDRWAFTSQGISEYSELNRQVVAVALRATREDQPVGIIRSERRQYVDGRGVPTFEVSTEAGIDYSLKEDTYVVLTGVEGERADVRIAFNPLVAWVWLGGAAMVIGAVMVMGPPAAQLPREARSRAT